MKICGRCDQPIRDGEEYTEYDIPSPSLGGTVVYRHTGRCQQVPTQTTQTPVWR